MTSIKKYFLIAGFFTVASVFIFLIASKIDRLDSLPDGNYTFGGAFCEDKDPIKINGTDKEEARRNTANLLLLDDITKKFSLKRKKATLIIESKSCRVTVFMQLKNNSDGILHFYSRQQTIWEPAKCQFTGHFNDEKFSWSQKNLRDISIFSSRNKGYQVYKKEQSFYHTLNFLPNDIPIKLKYGPNSTIHFVFQYRELRKKHDQIELEKGVDKKELTHSFDRFAFGCPVSQYGYFLEVLPEKKLN
ncbi:MAG: hypothetical protein HN509_03415 [Halobacteriovoraceae bacterium]|nr:hypothetical protein [Halobacteriovoraceae bacterium]